MRVNGSLSYLYISWRNRNGDKWVDEEYIFEKIYVGLADEFDSEKSQMP